MKVYVKSVMMLLCLLSAACAASAQPESIYLTVNNSLALSPIPYDVHLNCEAYDDQSVNSATTGAYMTPTPEPATIMLLGIAGLTLVGRHSRKQKTQKR